MKKCEVELMKRRCSGKAGAAEENQEFLYALRKFRRDCKNFATIAKILQSLRKFRCAQIFAKLAKFRSHFHQTRASLTVSRLVPEPRSPALSPLPCPASAPAAACGFVPSLSRPLPSLPVPPHPAVHSHHRRRSLQPRAHVALFPGPHCRHSSPQPSPGSVDP